MQYADDTLVFMNGNAKEIFYLKALLNSFAELSGLKVNYSKSMMVPINVPDDRFDVLANTFGCSKGSLPFTYLGLPLSIAKPTVAEFWPLVNRCERRLISTANFLSEAGRLELVNAVFTALPMFTMSTFLLPKTVIKQVDKYRRHCLWRGSDLSSKKPSKATWELVCSTKENGGLGVLDLEAQNQSLLLKNLHKFYNKANIPWVQLVWTCHYSNGSLPNTQKRRGSFWWWDSLKLLDQYKGMASALVQNGTSCFFWLDVWNHQLLSQSYPHLFSYVKDQKLTVLQVAQLEDLTEIFHLPLSEEAFQQLQELQIMLNHLSLTDDPDRWTYIWGSTDFTPSRAYKQLKGSVPTHPIFRWLWKTCCQEKKKDLFLAVATK